jgi:hypothetical protein
MQSINTAVRSRGLVGGAKVSSFACAAARPVPASLDGRNRLVLLTRGQEFEALLLIP